jgi:hypothetical protein
MFGRGLPLGAMKMVYRIRYIFTGELVKDFVFSNSQDALECIEFNSELFRNPQGRYFADNASDNFEVVEINTFIAKGMGNN